MGLNLWLVLAQHYLFAQRNQIKSKLCSLRARARPLSSIRIRLSPTLQLNTCGIGVAAVNWADD
jgi:hypothetical protein